MKSEYSGILTIALIAVFSLLLLGCVQTPSIPMGNNTTTGTGPAGNGTPALNSSQPALPANLTPLDISLIDVPAQSNVSLITIHGILNRNATLAISGRPIRLVDRAFTVNLTLVEGPNRFVFEAADQYGEKKTVVRVIEYAPPASNSSENETPVYIPANGTAAEKGVPVSITVSNNVSLLAFNITMGADVLNLGTISEGKSSARLVVLTNEQDSAVYVHFNGTGNISGMFEYPKPFTMYRLGEEHDIWIKAVIPANATLGTYSGEFLIQEIREKKA